TRVNREGLKLSERSLAVVQEVVKIGEEVGRPASQVAINWVRQQQHKAQMIPILGARTEAHLQDNLACLEWSLSEEHLKRLDDVSAIELGFPHDFLTGSLYVFGATFKQIDVHRQDSYYYKG
ncbi:MAG: aldo/keto reductase, partial [Anaerolineae bacterium]|nr:aldo/keto reductase [Anaerolineae bacterium]